MDGQTFVGIATSNGDTADATLDLSPDRRSLTMTLRPKAGSSDAGKVLTLVLQRS
jgi:hypothetical protein